MVDYSNNFDELQRIGSGGFGEVFKVKDKVDEQCYAIKKIKARKVGSINKETEKFEQVLREAKTLAKLNGDRIVRYMHSWIENDCVFIKMEFCSDNLKNLIIQKRTYFDRTETEPLSVLEFYISSQIFIELVECVQYLHGLQPPIIHRDIKPQNILISKNQKNKNCLKLCDFGLAIFHDMTSIYHTSGVGTFKYMAPEVVKGKYNYMADIYSMGVVAEELFDVELNEHEISLLDEKLNSIKQLILSMIETLISKRPNCGQIVDTFKKFSLKKSEIEDTIDVNTTIEDLLPKIPGNSIILDYLDNMHQIDDSDKTLITSTISNKESISKKFIEFLKINFELIPTLLSVIAMLSLNYFLANYFTQVEYVPAKYPQVIAPVVQDTVPEHHSSHQPIVDQSALDDEKYYAGIGKRLEYEIQMIGKKLGKLFK